MGISSRACDGCILSDLLVQLGNWEHLNGNGDGTEEFLMFGMQIFMYRLQVSAFLKGSGYFAGPGKIAPRGYFAGPGKIRQKSM